MTPPNMPAAEVDVDAALVRRLLESQCPDLVHDELVLVASGWDNVMFRLGRDHAVRLPRRQLAADLVITEQRWLPKLAPHLPLPIPVPVHAGRPEFDYPWSWSVCRWLDGEPALHTPPGDLDAAAIALGEFVRALRAVPVPPDPPANPYRGIPLARRDQITRDAIGDDRRLLAMWDEALALPPYDGVPVWLHGDLHPGNVLVSAGAVSAVIDFGDLTAGDPAGDLFLAWALFDVSARDTFRAAAGDIDDDTWARARAWALAFGAVVRANSADNPAYHRLGERMLEAVTTDWP